MKNIQLHKSVHTKLKKNAKCELTGRKMFPGEEIIVLPSRKKIVALPIFTPAGIIFIYLTVVPFIPERDYDLYLSQNRAMGMFTNVHF